MGKEAAGYKNRPFLLARCSCKQQTPGDSPTEDASRRLSCDKTCVESTPSDMLSHQVVNGERQVCWDRTVLGGAGFHMIYEHGETATCEEFTHRMEFKTLRYKPEGSIPDGVTKIFQWQSFRSHCGLGVDSASNRNEYQEFFLVVKTAGA
jgi:hypothetical protein